MDNRSVKLTSIGEPNTLYRKRWASTKEVDNSLFFLSVSALTAEVVRWELHSFRVSSHYTMTSNHGHCGRDDITTKSK